MTFFPRSDLLHPRMHAYKKLNNLVKFLTFPVFLGNKIQCNKLLLGQAMILNATEGALQSFPHIYVFLPRAPVEGFLNTEALKLKYKLKETKSHRDWNIWIFSLKQDLGSYWECYEVTESFCLLICRGKDKLTRFEQDKKEHMKCIQSARMKNWFEKTSRFLYGVMIEAGPKRHQMGTNMPEPLKTSACGEPANPQ